MLPFLFTKYFFPLPKAIVLSKSLGYEFDNPRTEEEVNYVYKRLKNIKTNHLVDRVLNGIKDKFIQKYSKYNEYIEKFLEDHERDELYFLAKICCIIRFDDDGKIAKMEHNNQEEYVLLNDNDPLVQRVKAAINYSRLLALLSHDEEKYMGEDFIFTAKMYYSNSYIDYDLPSTSEFTYAVLMLGQDLKDVRGEYTNSWHYWKNGSNNFLESSSRLESSLKTQPNKYNNQLLYIGELLGIINESHDKRIKLLMLTSIIELLVTHNPNSNRFNVEDSISKQFKLKASILVYLNNKAKNVAEKKKYDLNELAKEFDTIYGYRSDIAHGNFSEKDNNKKDNNKKDNMDGLIANLYSYVRAILEEYLNDEQFVKFIKEK